MQRAVVTSTVALLIALWFGAAAAAESVKAPLPADDRQAESLKQIRELFKEDYAKKRIDDRGALARKLFKHAQDTGDDAVARYVLDREACELAIKVGDAATALGAIDDLARQYQVNASDERQRVLTGLMPTVSQPEAYSQISEGFLQLAGEAADHDDYAAAGKLLAIADQNVRKAHDDFLASRIKDKLDEVKELGEQYKLTLSANVDLLGNPVDPESAGKLGRFNALLKGDWEVGLPLLAASNDETLKALAQAEIAKPATPAAQARLGEDWWSFAEKQKGTVKERAAARAAEWLRQALPALTGADKLKAERRLDEAEKIGQGDQRKFVSRFPSGAVLLLTFEKPFFAKDGDKLVALDASSKKNNALVVGATPVSGAFGTALSFDGKNSYLQLGNPPSLQIVGSQTISLWINPAALDMRRNPLNKSYGGEGTMTLETNGQMNYFYGTAGVDANPYMGFAMTDPVKANTWSHLVAIRDLKAKKLYWYKNGVRVNEGEALYPEAKASARELFIGKGYANNFVGLIDDVAIYDRALSEAEVVMLFKASMAGRLR